MCRPGVTNRGFFVYIHYRFGFLFISSAPSMGLFYHKICWHNFLNPIFELCLKGQKCPDSDFVAAVNVRTNSKTSNQDR